LQPGSLPHIHAVIRRALNVAVRWQVLVTKPAVLVDAQQAPRMRSSHCRLPRNGG
jgi:hypothetical protein